jgi:glycosyltransferase involved in cell wall biosynthesis
MRVCYFGTYDADYVRNRVLIAGLRAQGVDVMVCHSQLWADTAAKVRAAAQGILNPNLWWACLRAYAHLVRQYSHMGGYDVLVVGYAGHVDIFLARFLTWLARRPLVFDVFLSLHETVIIDRGLAARRSLLAALLFGMEKLGCALADLVLLDTTAHIHYFAHKYNLPEAKFRRIWVGAEETYRPGIELRPTGPFTVIYFGKFIPLHGVEYILAAARELANADVCFDMVGGGQTYAAMRRLAQDWGLKNIIWGPEWLDPPALRERIARADACLGIFGTSAKAQRVVPTKAYVALAMRKALITANSPAAREALIPGEHALLCPPGDAHALARCILTLKENPQQCAQIAQNGHALFQQHYTPEAIGREMKTALEELRAGRARPKRV